MFPYKFISELPMTETNIINETNEPKSVSTPLLSETQKSELLANLSNFDEHLVQLLDNKHNETLANSTKTDFQSIASTVSSFFDHTNLYTPEMSALYYENKTAYFAKMADLEIKQRTYNFKVASQLVKELEPSLPHSKAFVIAKTVCSVFKVVPPAGNLITLFSKPNPVFENDVENVKQLCTQINAIKTMYDSNLEVVDNAFSIIADLIANPSILISSPPEHGDL